MCILYAYKLFLKFSSEYIHLNYFFYCFECCHRVCPYLPCSTLSLIYLYCMWIFSGPHRAKPELHWKPESVATLPPFGPIEGQKWFDRISSQWESQKNRFALIYFGKIRFLPPCVWNIPFMSYSLRATDLSILNPHVISKRYHPLRQIPRAAADREIWNWGERRRRDTNHESVRACCPGWSSVASFVRALQSNINIHYNVGILPIPQPPLITEALPDSWPGGTWERTAPNNTVCPVQQSLRYHRLPPPRVLHVCYQPQPGLVTWRVGSNIYVWNVFGIIRPRFQKETTR